MKQSKDTYMEPIIIENEKAIIRVYRPILDDAERARRMKRIYDSAAKLIMEAQKVGAAHT